MVAEVADLQDAYEDSSDEDIMVEDDLYQDEVLTNLRILCSRKKYPPKLSIPLDRSKIKYLLTFLLKIFGPFADFSTRRRRSKHVTSMMTPHLCTPSSRKLRTFLKSHNGKITSFRGISGQS